MIEADGKKIRAEKDNAEPFHFFNTGNYRGDDRGHDIEDIKNKDQFFHQRRNGKFVMNMLHEQGVAEPGQVGQNGVMASTG